MSIGARLSIFAALLLATVATASAADPLRLRLAEVAPLDSDCDIFTVDSRIDPNRMADLEGVWLTTGSSDGTFLILKDSHTGFYNLYAVNSADRRVVPGTVMGIAAQSARRGVFDAEIYTHVADSRLTSPKRFTLTLSSDGFLQIQPVKNQLKVNLMRLIPYMYRVSITRVNDRPSGLDGAIRLNPAPAKPVGGPRRL